MNTAAPDLTPLTPRQATRIVKKAKIIGDSFIVNDQPYNLSPKYLLKIGFLPEFTTQLQGLNFAFSRPYHVGTHLAVTAFVENDRHVHVSSYYRHPIRGVWCFLPEYYTTHAHTDSPIQHFGSGYGLESVILPTSLQQPLQQLATLETLDLDQSHAYFCFAGTARRFRHREQFLDQLRDGELQSPYYQTVAPKPILRLTPPSSELTRPDQLTLTGNLAPAFNTLKLSAYSISTPFCHTAAVDLCQSQDGKLEYSFCRDLSNPAAPRAWLSHVQVRTRLTSLGLHRHWATTGDFSTPLYTTQSRYDQYLDPHDREPGGYLGLWSRYLSQTPFLQAYLNALEIDKTASLR